MPIVSLSAGFVRRAVCIPARKKVDYFDASQRGFLLEVRQSGGKTYYQRYTDERGRERQYKIGPAEVLTLDQARRKGKQVVAEALLGADPQQKRRDMGALHQVNGAYYGAAPGSGHPDDKLGWVFGAGIKLNAPIVGQGDYFQAQINYTQGALRYVFQTPSLNWGKIDGNSAGFGALTDAFYDGTITAGNAADLQLTTAWNINAAYEHFWNPRWRTSLYGGYAAVSYNKIGNTLACDGDPGCDMLPNISSTRFSTSALASS